MANNTYSPIQVASFQVDMQAWLLVLEGSNATPKLDNVGLDAFRMSALPIAFATADRPLVAGQRPWVRWRRLAGPCRSTPRVCLASPTGNDAGQARGRNSATRWQQWAGGWRLAQVSPHDAKR